MNNHKSEKKIMWYSLAFMAFSTVWGFGNVINGFSEYGGLKAIVSWALIFAIYFVPYALMVGEMGSAFKEAGGGVSSWILETIGPRMAYLAGWTYWIVHMPYISQKPNGAVIATSWAIFRDARISQMDVKLMAVICLALFLFAVWVASKGIGVLNKLTSLAGSTMFIMSILFIIMMIAAPAITGADVMDIEWSVETFMPTFDSKFFLNLSILVFAVGGCENNIPPDLMTNGAYYAFQKLGEYYHVGDFFVVVYALTNLIGQFAVLILSIDAPLRMLLDSADENYIPKALFKQNKHGTYTNGHKLVMVIVSLLIIVPAFGIESVDVLVKWLVKVNSVCMPLRYLWVFVAYIALKKAGDKFHAEYRFVKNKTVGIIFGVWCFAFTAFACITGIYSEDPFQLVMNIVTPFVLIGLGFIMPIIAKRSKNK